MSICHYGLVDGVIKPVSEITISPFDRSYLFGDGVYEVIPIHHGQFIYLSEHLARLATSLKAINIPHEKMIKDLGKQLYILLERNQPIKFASVYLQISRGISKPRTHDYGKCSQPTFFAYINSFTPPSKKTVEKGGRAVLLEDIRWGRCDIKSVNLLANCMAKEHARQQGADEAFLYQENGFVTEGSASSIFAVLDGVLYTTPLGVNILPGITRYIVSELAQELDLTVKEKMLSTHELVTADEVFITSSTKDLYPIVYIDEHQIGNGYAGPVWEKLYTAYQEAKDTLIDNYPRNH